MIFRFFYYFCSNLQYENTKKHIVFDYSTDLNLS